VVLRYHGSTVIPPNTTWDHSAMIGTAALAVVRLASTSLPGPATRLTRQSQSGPLVWAVISTPPDRWNFLAMDQSSFSTGLQDRLLEVLQCGLPTTSSYGSTVISSLVVQDILNGLNTIKFIKKLNRQSLITLILAITINQTELSFRTLIQRPIVKDCLF